MKTGTTYDFADNWLFGYDSRITCGIWVGFLEGKKPIYNGAFSSDTCASVLGAAVTEAERLLPRRGTGPAPQRGTGGNLPDHREESHAQLL